MIEEALASLKRERERVQSPESRQTACAACVLCGRPTVATRMSQKGAITTVISCLQNDKSNPPNKKQTKFCWNGSFCGKQLMTGSSRSGSQLNVCALKFVPTAAPTLVLKSIPNNRMGNFNTRWPTVSGFYLPTGSGFYMATAVLGQNNQLIPCSQWYAGRGSQTSQTTGREVGGNRREKDDRRISGRFSEIPHHGPPTMSDENRLVGM